VFLRKHIFTKKQRETHWNRLKSAYEQEFNTGIIAGIPKQIHAWHFISAVVSSSRYAGRTQERCMIRSAGIVKLGLSDPNAELLFAVITEILTMKFG